MADVSIFNTLAPYHIIAYGTHLGAQVWQSFVSGITAYQTLERSQFNALQQRVFPRYFTFQTALPFLVALTYPGANHGASSYHGALAPANQWSVLYPLTTAFVCGLVNLVFLGPKTSELIRLRKAQEVKDGKKSIDPAPHSKDMLTLNKRFARVHGASALVNMVSLGATVWYGVGLSARL
ncbi:hypothetical protein V496_03566 [Pseudogymnoascus sp. VKM F-4515 (FW-2607)]|nr:hypothetical protein V496_03566 [Pseudogymnoascus sp. VKM F-4515 (FW-2607)]KFY92407.1 hypothetical protein V498_04965 [Pseudogymnoascus sp. VKM F-4517 (FW-2822)]